MNKIAVVTGGSSGIGLAAVKALISKGFTVYEFSRHNGTDSGAIHITADVSDTVSVSNAITQVINEQGRIDVLINNAGFGISGAAEFTDNDEAKRLLEVNLFGTVNTVNAVTPHMRKQGSGTIINISSVAAEVAIPFQTWYSISKSAVSSYTAALRGELGRFGIKVCAVVPGDICTGFTSARVKDEIGDDIYKGAISRSVAVMEHDEQNGMDPARVGDVIAKAAVSNSPKPFYVVGISYKFLVLLARFLPKRLSCFIVKQIYAK